MKGLSDIAGLGNWRAGGHGGRLGITFAGRGDDWAELLLPYAADLAGDGVGGGLASGPIIALMDMATSIAVWIRRGRFVPHATLDLRMDYLRAPVPGQPVIGRGECYRLTPAVSFVRGQAHHGDPADPIAHVVGTYMNLGAA